MKKIIPFLLMLVLMTMACNISVNLTPEAGPIVINPGSGSSTEPAPEVPMVPTMIPANVSCNEVSFYLDPSIGTSYTCETIPEANEPDAPYFAINPQYTAITIQGYPLGEGTFFDAHINVYPFGRLREMIPGANDDYSYLQRLLSGELPGEMALPFLPYFNAAQLFHTQYAILTFHNGSGIRYLTEFAQNAAAVNNEDLTYTFQGVTSDGQYWISALLPVNHPMLPANSLNPPNGQSWEDFSNNYGPYIADMQLQLDSQSWDSYTPRLGMLDDLIWSITIQP
jgi:hypothetical protein